MFICSARTSIDSATGISSKIAQSTKLKHELAWNTHTVAKTNYQRYQAVITHNIQYIKMLI